MIGTSLTYRLSAALVALLFGLGWVAPQASYACGRAAAASCHDRPAAKHCHGGGDISAVCLSHHANQDARAAQTVGPDLNHGGGTPRGPIRTVVPASIATHLLPSPSWWSGEYTAFHARVGVWLE